MKTKRRPVNIEQNMCNKKIITRNMKNKIQKNKQLPAEIGCVNFPKNKAPPNTRAKSTGSGKQDSDPYSISKMDEDYKVPVKKMKITEKIEKQVSISTCSVSTMTDPELLGPCEPGTSISLQGIVWLETDTGLLVINVTWKGRNYAGTLLDSTKYQFTTSFNPNDCPIKFEDHATNVTNRGRKRYIPPRVNHHSGLRTNAIRHSRRLSESFSYTNNLKKSSTRPSQNANSCYVDSLSISAEASCSGESDCEKHSYSKVPTANKTRSVTRSLAKQNKALLKDHEYNSSESERLQKSIECTQNECFKKFTNEIALRYHLHRSHGVFEVVRKLSEIDQDSDARIGFEELRVKLECTDNIDDNVCLFSDDKTESKRLNGKNNNENDNYEFTSDSEIEVHNKDLDSISDTKVKIEKNELCLSSNMLFGNKEQVHCQLADLSVNLSELPKSISMSNDDLISTIETVCKSQTIPVDDVATTTVDLSERNHCSFITARTSDITSYDPIASSENITAHSNHIIRTVSAPTVYIPLDVSTSTDSNHTLPNATVSPALIRPKPTQNPIIMPQIPTSNTERQIKIHSQQNINQNFQIPSSTISTKKRALVPLKVSVTQSVSTNLVKIPPNSTSLNITTPNPSCRNNRTTSSFSTMTHILPATTSVSSVAQLITNSNVHMNPVSNGGALCSVSHNNNISIKRTIITSNSTSPVGINSILSLKPIQPKPKISGATITTYSNSTASPVISPVSTTILSTLIPNQTPTYQRQILPSPNSKTENGTCCDDKIFHKVDPTKSTVIKKKRRKPEKKPRSVLLESTKLAKLPLNQIQPKQNKDYPEFISNCTFFPSSLDNYKMDEENSHSPEYSDLSETNDTPAPILEKEIELKSSDCDKLVICTDFETTESPNRHISSCSDSYDDAKDNTQYNKPPALMPAVLSTDLLNGTTNEIDLQDSVVKTGRWKITNTKRSSISNGTQPDKSKNFDNFKNFTSSFRHNNAIVTSSRRSFQTSLTEESTSTQVLSAISQTNKVSLYNTSHNDNKQHIQNPKLKLSNKSSNLSAINDYVWMTKNSQNCKSKTLNKNDDKRYSVKSSRDGEDGTTKVIQAQTHQSNGRFSVQALTGPQDSVSRSITSPSTVISANPNTKLANSLSKINH